ncbi:MAG: hypothetical protein HYR60_18540 [Acidobacteria bacterium]|nr:hypothetical protein [Acidobacteriota bacterium]
MADLEFDDLPTLELIGYRTLIAEIPPPTDDQLRAFAVFAADAKSWYKHLPPFPPGAPFYFFIDPCAGLDRVRLSREQAVFYPRTESTEPFHYTWMTTGNYRARYGCLSFCCESGSQLFLPRTVVFDDGSEVRGMLDNNPVHPFIYPGQDRPFRVPREVLEAGRADITGVVHSQAASVWFWERVFSTARSDPRWPEETGGAETIARIRERQGRVLASPEAEGQNLSAADPEIEALVRPERERMQMEMIAAMKRMRELVYPAA